MYFFTFALAQMGGEQEISVAKRPQVDDTANVPGFPAAARPSLERGCAT
jgi:hypothetical protein